MKFASSSTSRPDARAAAGFTLAEVLAALLFMAIVIPVAVEGLQIASRAGEVARRKTDAARIAERVISENLLTTNTFATAQNGTFQDGPREYQWTLRNEPWSQDQNVNAPHLLTAEVTYTVQGQDYTVQLCTLANSQ